MCVCVCVCVCVRVCVCVVGKGTLRELLRLKCSGVNIMANELLIEGKYKQLQN